MKIKSFMMMAMAAVAFVFGMSSCSSSSDDDQTEAPLADLVVGSYTGNEVVIVDSEESSNETKTYEFTRSQNMYVNMTIPEIGMGMMTIPSLSVKDIELQKNGNTISGRTKDNKDYTGSVSDSQGNLKEYTVKDLTVLFSDKTVVAKFSLKYGTMPFWLSFTYTGDKK